MFAWSDLVLLGKFHLVSGMEVLSNINNSFNKQETDIFK